MRIVLPYPPSINHYWRHVGAKVLISSEGRLYRERVAASVAGQDAWDQMTGRLAVGLDIAPPDRRQRDLDNVQKALLDGLQHAGVYENDSQIDWLLTRRRPVSAGGHAIVNFEPPGTVDAIDHLRRCRTCQAAVLAHKQETDRAILRKSDPAAAD